VRACQPRRGACLVCAAIGVAHVGLAPGSARNGSSIVPRLAATVHRSPPWPIVRQKGAGSVSGLTPAGWPAQR
jgi:hypothetical protein